jgi:hypothetical protein
MVDVRLARPCQLLERVGEGRLAPSQLLEMVILGTSTPSQLLRQDQPSVGGASPIFLRNWVARVADEKSRVALGVAPYRKIRRKDGKA